MATTDWMTDDPASLLDRLSYHDVAKTIDHSLLRPELDDEFIDENVRLAVEYDVASVTVPAGRCGRGSPRCCAAWTRTSGRARSSAFRTATC